MTGLPPHPVNPPAAPTSPLASEASSAVVPRGACPLTHSLVTRDKGCKQPGGKFESTQSHQPTAAAWLCPHSSAQQASRAGGSLRGSGPRCPHHPPTQEDMRFLLPKNPQSLTPLEPQNKGTKGTQPGHHRAGGGGGDCPSSIHPPPRVSYHLRKSTSSWADPEPPILGLRDSL